MLKELPKSCDFFGYVPNFEINKNKSFTSVYGIIVSILIFRLVIFSVWIFGKEIIMREKPSMIVSEYNDPDPLLIDLTKDNFQIALGLQFPNYTLYIHETISTISASQIITTRYSNGTTSNDISEIEMVPCSTINITLLPEYFDKLDLNNLYCFKDGNIYIQGDFGGEKWAYISMAFHPCKNSTYSNICRPNEEIADILNGGYFGFCN